MSLYDRIMEGGGYDDPSDLPEFDKHVLDAARETEGASGWSSRGFTGKTVNAIIKTMRKRGIVVKSTAGKKKVEKALERLQKRDLLSTSREGTWSEKAGGHVYHTRVHTPSATTVKASGYKELLEKRLKAAGIKSASVESGRGYGDLGAYVRMSIPDVVKLAALPSFKLPTKEEARAYRHAKGK